MNTLPIYKSDSWLEPYANIINDRHRKILNKVEDIKADFGSLEEFALAHEYYGLHLTNKGWVFREWAPNATQIFLIGDFSDWKEKPEYELHRIEFGNWEIELPQNALKHTDKYKLSMHWNGGQGERIPAYVRRVVQNDDTKLFDAQVWQPEHPFEWTDQKFKVDTKQPRLIYEAHIGMSGETEGVATYDDFRRNVLPHVIATGYNTLQLMAIQEHPYYGSFGYHVSNFFAASSRFGSPEDLKRLINEAHEAGIAVIMDIVHSHAVKNENEGLSKFDGTTDLYFHYGERGNHPAWDSRCFNYGRIETLRLLLSNDRFWIDEYHFDGYRFDGVTSMLYYDHGLGKDFTCYADYFRANEDEDAIIYLALANMLIHSIKPYAVTIAEEMSGFPGIAGDIDAGGLGFDLRLSMGIPDYWIKIIKELRDEDWKPSSILWELTNRRRDEKTISYCESHDQALVGDKTIIFRLIDSDMYWHFKKGDENSNVNRGIALHKMIRLATLGTTGGGYLNFMGNEFGHPEWVDFPREGNGWSYKYARRQWNLVDNKELCYHYLGDFDTAMLKVLKKHRSFEKQNVVEIWHNDGDQVFAFRRGDLLFFFNFSPCNSYTGYGFMVEQGAYEYLLNTDNPDFGGNGFNDDKLIHYTNYDGRLARDNKGWLQLYLPTRTACVLRKMKE